MIGKIVARILLTLAIAAVLFFTLWAWELVPAPLGLGLAFCVVVSGAGVVTFTAVFDRSSLTAEAEWYTAEPREPSRTAASSDTRLNRLRHMLDDAVRGESRDNELNELLTVLIHDRLEQRGIDIGEHPEAAREALGPELTTYLENIPAPSTPISQRTVLTVVKRIEEM